MNFSRSINNRVVVGALTAMAAIGVGLLPSGTVGQTAPVANAHRAVSEPLTGVLAHVPGGNTVGGEVREKTVRSDGYYHIDTPKMIARLKALHVNTVNYLIWYSRSDWDDLRNEFLPAAEKAGIKVWAYIAPPHESVKRASFPYKTDYVAWAKALAELSLKHPSLEAWAMDDFSPRVFTPDYLAEMQDAAHGINPKFRFFAVVLPQAITEKWVANYASLVDGVVAPYFYAPADDCQRIGTLDPQIDGAHKLLKPKGIPLYFLIYVGRRFHAPLEPTPDYASRAVGACIAAMRQGRLEGVVSYGTPIDTDVPPTRNNHALDGNGCLSLGMSEWAAHAGDWASASQTISIDPQAPRYWLRFWHNDGWGAGDPAKVLVKEDLIDDQVVWKYDPASDGADFWFEGGPLEGPIDLTEVLKGKKTAKLTLRLRVLKDFARHAINVEFDRVSGTGITIKDGGFETGEGWTLADSNGTPVAEIDRYDPDRPAKVFNAVASAFAGFHPG
jgi:hypothetical protein